LHLLLISQYISSSWLMIFLTSPLSGLPTELSQSPSSS
jgi:hypothetical protein